APWEDVIAAAWPLAVVGCVIPVASQPGRPSMRLRALGIIGVAAIAGQVQISDAVVPPKDGDAPFVAADRAPRTHRATAFERGGRIAAAGLAGWTALWDRDTDVPLRLWGEGPLAVGAVASPAVAEAAACQFLAAHL